MSAKAGAREIAKAPFSASLSFNLFHILPNFLQGLFAKKPKWVARLARFDLDRRTVRLIARLKVRKGGLVWIRVFASKALLVLDRGAVDEVLERSPRVYAEPKLKRKGMSHFQPHSVTLSRGDDWADRRRFNEAVLNTGKPLHKHARRFFEIVQEETGRTLEEASGTLAWQDFSRLFQTVTRQIVFGREARSEEGLSAELKAMMQESNRVFGLGKSKHFESFYGAVRRHLEQPTAESLAEDAARAESSERTRVENQIPHWMFAMADTLGANTVRALALIASHPEAESRLREELGEAALDDPRTVAGLPYLEGCLQEAMRLWPTTPLLSREAVSDDVLAGARVPAGTQVLVSNLFNHRDSETFPYADRFSPEVWQKPETRRHFHHFSGGTQVCAGMDLALFVGKAVLARLLAHHRFVLEGPPLDPAKPLPYSYDFFKTRFRPERLRSSAGTAGDQEATMSPTPDDARLAAKAARVSLDDLQEMSLEELDELFLWASTPTIRELDGETNGRACAGVMPADELPWMPWKGKVFEPVSETEGRGKNRIESSFIDLFKFKLFEFKTRVVPPLKGDDDVVTLDYDLKGNPRIIRRIRDDLKKLREGLFLGTANLKKDDGFKFILYFALQLKD